MKPMTANLFRMFPNNWKQGDEDDDWKSKAIETLVKKLKKTDPDSHKLLETVLCQKRKDTRCIVITRPNDGRIQVNHKKSLPHVMYCRVFRWPDLLSQHELKPVPNCQFPAKKTSDRQCQYPADRKGEEKVCVNPYHYDRVGHPQYPPVVAPRSDFINYSPPLQSPLSPNSSYSHQQGNPNYFQQTASLATSNQALMIQPAHEPINYQSSLQNSYCYNYPGQQQLQNQVPAHNPTGYDCSNAEAIYHNYSAISNGSLISVTDASRGQQIFESQSPPPSYSTRADQNSPGTITPMDCVDEPPVPRDDWCRIQYMELAHKIGEPFKSSSPMVFVDGFTHPATNNPNRFSLGVLSNINRAPKIEQVRCAIRKGVCLENKDGQVLVKNLSESNIFFQSKNCNVENQLNQHTVVKIEPQRCQKIFDFRVFESLVQAAVSSGDGDSYERLFALTDHCIIKMSFVKGWGSYYNRQDVTSTPCWIEIVLLKPHELIDKYIQHIRPSATHITSTS